MLYFVLLRQYLRLSLRRKMIAEQFLCTDSWHSEFQFNLDRLPSPMYHINILKIQNGMWCSANYILQITNCCFHRNAANTANNAINNPKYTIECHKSLNNILATWFPKLECMRTLSIICLANGTMPTFKCEFVTIASAFCHRIRRIFISSIVFERTSVSMRSNEFHSKWLKITTLMLPHWATIRVRNRLK